MKVHLADLITSGPFEAETEVEIVIGHDRLVRINVDGVCRHRVRLGPDAKLAIRRDDQPPVITP